MSWPAPTIDQHEVVLIWAGTIRHVGPQVWSCGRLLPGSGADETFSGALARALDEVPVMGR